jgi:hypothetical protein
MSQVFSVMGTLGGFPNPPAVWLRRAKPAYANAHISAVEFLGESWE